MAEERRAEEPKAEERKDLFTRLAEVGEDAIHRISDLPGATKLTDSVNNLRTRVDDLQRRVRGLDELERRVTELEQRVEELSGKPARRRTTRSGAATLESETAAPTPEGPPASKPRPGSAGNA